MGVPPHPDPPGDTLHPPSTPNLLGVTVTGDVTVTGGFTVTGFAVGGSRVSVGGCGSGVGDPMSPTPRSGARVSLAFGGRQRGRGEGAAGGRRWCGDGDGGWWLHRHHGGSCRHVITCTGDSHHWDPPPTHLLPWSHRPTCRSTHCPRPCVLLPQQEGPILGSPLGELGTLGCYGEGGTGVLEGAFGCYKVIVGCCRWHWGAGTPLPIPTHCHSTHPTHRLGHRSSKCHHGPPSAPGPGGGTPSPSPSSPPGKVPRPPGPHPYRGAAAGMERAVGRAPDGRAG